ncbi:MAG: hypothetical protein NWE88_01525 [Candidatus Bathyarchaeota archaeon]|nr:hypothetical protein [Candidatus Bathyarchaeota archaeon]
MVGNSPVSSLIEEKDGLEAEYDSLDLIFQSLEAELDSTQELLVKEQKDNALLQERYLEMLALDQENQLLKQQVIDLESEITSLQNSYDELEIENEEIDNLKMQLESLNETYQELILAYSSKFVISDLEVNPEEIEINQPVTISVIIQNIGGLEGSYNLQLKIGDILEASKEVTLIGGESITTSFDVIKDEANTYNFTLNGFSGTFKFIRPLWCEIGLPYVAPDGLTVTLTSLTITEKVGSYQYTIWYTLKNEQPDRAIDEGTFKMYYESESGGLPQYGFFGILFPGDSLSRTYTFEELKGKLFGILAYHHEQFFSSEPLEDSLKWKVEIP